MAILNGIISKLCGSAGNLTFKRNGGQTVVSEKITQKKDAKTGQQLKQRMKWANIIREYQVLQPYMKNVLRLTVKGYCLLNSRTTVESDNFFNFNQFPRLRNLKI